MSARRMRAVRALEASEASASEASASDGEDGNGARAVNPFAALLGSDDGEGEESEGEETDEAAAAVAVVEEGDEAAVAAATPESGRKKKNRRGGKRGKRGKKLDDDDDDDDDLDALVREVTGMEVAGGVSGGAAAERASGAGTASTRLLAVDMRNMKAEDELKRIFGGRVINAVEAEETGRAGGRGAAFKAKLQRRCTFSPYRDQWATYRSEGLYMVSSGVVDAASGMSEFSFAWKDDYVRANFDFEIAVGSHDPHRLFHVLHNYPWHLESLLRISELYHYSGQAQESAEILERCLYGVERAWHPNFMSAAASGLAFVDSSKLENKPMFESLFRHVIALTRRGCHKTALECAKLLLGLDHTDPKGVLCMISYFALRCGEEKWLLEFIETFGLKRWVDRHWVTYGSLLNYPDFAYSKAMALYTVEEDVQVADTELLKAMLSHPYALAATMWKLEAAVSSDKDWQEILSHAHFDFSKCALDSRSLEHLSDIFATRHHLLWRPDPILNWAKRVARKAIELVDSKKPSTALDGLTAADFATISLENWPTKVENEFSHLIPDDFIDVVKRALPEDDPLAHRPAQARGGPGDFSDSDDD